MFASISRALRLGGSLVVMDFHRFSGGCASRILRHVRLGGESAVHEIEAGGLRLAEERPFLRRHYFIHFAKD